MKNYSLSQIRVHGISLLLFAISIFPLTVSGQIKTYNDAINKAGRQRMISQRIAKDFLLLMLEVETDKYQRELDESLTLFESQHREIKAFIEQKNISTSHKGVEKLWKKYRLLSASKLTNENAKEIILTSQDILIACNKVVSELEREANSASGEIINISGRQRMLSQRIALFYLAKCNGIEIEFVSRSYIESISQFEEAMSYLHNAKSNNKEIKDLLREADSQWQFSLTSFNQLKDGRKMPGTIALNCNILMDLMNQVTNLYAKSL